MSDIGLKIISKVSSEKVKKVLPDLISTQQRVYVKNRRIGESERLISDVIGIAEIKKWVTTEKVFDSLDHNFLISTLEKYGFGKHFI